MPVTPEQAAQWIEGLPPEHFAAIRELVMSREDASELLSSKFDRALSQISDTDLADALKNNPALVLRIEDRLAKRRNEDNATDLQINITPAKIKDTSVERIISECDDELFERYAGVVDNRRRRTRASVARKARQADTGLIEEDRELVPA